MNRDIPPAASEVLAHLQARHADLVWLLERMTRAESPSNEPDSQQEIREIIASEFERLGFVVRRVPGRLSGGMLRAVVMPPPPSRVVRFGNGRSRLCR